MDIRDIGLRAFLRDRAGNIGIMAAASSALVIGVLALGVDYGHLTLQRRSLQHASDLASIAAAANLDKAEAAALAYFTANRKRLAVRNGDRLMTASGDFPFAALAMRDDIDGYAEIVKGRYSADPAIAPEDRFVAGAMPYNAAKVTTMASGDLFFAQSLAARPDIIVRSVASASEQAAFSVGSRLASLDGGVLNKVLGALLGTNITLSAMDYRALLDADVDLFAFSEALASRLRLTGATYDDLLHSEIGLGDFIGALGGTRGLSPSVAALLNGVGRSLGSTQARIRLDKLIESRTL